MKIRCLILLICLITLSGIVSAQDILNHKTSAKQAAMLLPAFSDISCKFKQEKTIKSAQGAPIILKSGGDFKFVKSKGVTFETTYPVRSVSSYTASQNKQVSGIIKAVSEKNYTYLEKNFDIYFTKNPSAWEMALKPKAESKIASQMKMIYIKGKTHINNLNIETNGSITDVQFTDCR